MNQHVKTAEPSYRWWTAALQGERLEYEGRHPQPGYFRHRQAAVAFWHADGAYQCAVSTGYEPEKPDEIEELFASCNRYPVDYATYAEVAGGGEWPAAYLIDLTLKEIQDGVIWTPAWARQQFAERQELARQKRDKIAAETAAEEARKAAEAKGKDVTAELQKADAETPKIGHNSGEEHLLVRDRLNAILVAYRAWLKEIGGKIDSEERSLKAKGFQDEADAIRKEAEEKHKTEKAPHLEAGRAVDAKWITGETSIKSQAERLRASIQAVRTPFESEQDRKRAEEHRKAREAAEEAKAAAAAKKVEQEKREAEARKAAEEAKAQGQPYGVVQESFLPPEPVFDLAPPPARITIPKAPLKTTRTRDVLIITDFEKVVRVLLRKPNFCTTIGPTVTTFATRELSEGVAIEGCHIEQETVAK